VEGLSGGDEIQARIGRRQRLGLAVGAAVAGRAIEQAVAGGAHRGVGLHRQHLGPAGQQVACQEAGAGAHVGHRDARAQRTFGLKPIEHRGRVVGPRGHVVGDLGAEDRQQPTTLGVQRGQLVVGGFRARGHKR
jgi:hypothetical protein